MTINDKISIYLAKDFTENRPLNGLGDLDKQAGKYIEKVCDILNKFGKSKHSSYDSFWRIQEVSPDEILNENKGVYNNLCTEKAISSYNEGTADLEKITVITKKKIDDNLLPEEKEAAIKNYRKQIADDIEKFNFDDNSLRFTHDIIPVSEEELYNGHKNFFEKLYSKDEELDLLEKWKYEKISENDFKSAYKYAKESEVFSEDLAKELASQLGWRKNWQIKEIQGDKYIYNPDKFDVGGTDMDQVELDAYKIGQKLDSNGDILKALIVCPAKDYFDEGITDNTAIINDDNGSLCLYNDKPNRPSGGIRGRVGIIEPLDMRFMKDVIEVHGTDDNAITTAVETIQTIKGENQQFAANLLNGVTNSDEYKYAYDQEQGNSNETGRKKGSCL